MDTPSVFISYSHKDAKWLDRLQVHLRPLERLRPLRIWHYYSVELGDAWRSEVRDAIQSASVIVLLISADFLASDFCVTEEIPRLLEQHSREDLVVVPILVRPCNWQSVSWLRPFKVRPQDSIPLNMQEGVDETLAQLAAEIHSNLEAVANNRKRTRQTKLLGQLRRLGPSGDVGKKVFISRCEEDGDFAELLKGKLLEAGIPAQVGSDCLPVGADWRAEIDQAIEESSALVVVMTPDARRSEYVTYEWAYALGNGVPVIPVMLKPTQFHPRLESLQYLDFTNRKARPWPELIDILRIGKASSWSTKTNKSH